MHNMLFRWFSAAVLMMAPTLGQAGEEQIPAPAGQFLGSIAFNGGLALNQEVHLTAPEMVKFFSIRVPEFCGAVEMFETQVLVSGTGFVVTPVPRAKGVFAVNDGNGSYIDGVRVSLNGPVNSQCNILVFREDNAAGGNEPEPQPQPGGAANFGLACVTNQTPYVLPLSMLVGNFRSLPNIAPGATLVVTVPLAPGMRGEPVFLLSFDSNLRWPVVNKHYTLTARPGVDSSDCRQGANYDLRMTSAVTYDLFTRR